MKTLIEAIIQQESGGNDQAIGDLKLKNKAYGPLQIRKPCTDDVNRVFGLNLRPQDCLGNRSLSIKVFEHYMAIYATTGRIGRSVTDQDRARIWNGGPNGWKKPATEKYWKAVERAMKG